MTAKHPPKKSPKKRLPKKELKKLVDEAVKKVVTEYGDVLRKLGKE